MASLTAHLREPGDHGRLPFHATCPVCVEQRLAGALPADALLPRRSQALLAAGVLAFSSVAPAWVLAAEGDQDQTGAADATVVSQSAGIDDGPQVSDESAEDPAATTLADVADADADADADVEPDLADQPDTDAEARPAVSAPAANAAAPVGG